MLFSGPAFDPGTSTSRTSGKIRQGCSSERPRFNYRACRRRAHGASRRPRPPDLTGPVAIERSVREIRSGRRNRSLIRLAREKPDAANYSQTIRSVGLEAFRLAIANDYAACRAFFL